MLEVDSDDSKQTKIWLLFFVSLLKSSYRKHLRIYSSSFSTGDYAYLKRNHHEKYIIISANEKIFTVDKKLQK